ncbi:MAG: DUF1015 domain-containing protein [Pseudomonadota bacterium]
MSKIIPFPALLPKASLVHRIACPPYDVITADEARAFVSGNPCSLLRVTRAEVDLPGDIDEHDDRVYARARENYENFKKEGWLLPDQTSFYIYRLEDRGHVQTGLVCGASVDEYDSGKIKQHEKTRKPKEDDRTCFACTIGAHAEPVILVFRSDAATKRLLAEGARGQPLFDVTDKEGVRHVLWRASATDDIRKAFERVAALYVADGHHRSAAASRVRAVERAKNPSYRGDEPCNFFPAVLFPDDEVKIYRYDWAGDPKERPQADVTMADIIALSDQGGIMPPKSTWFAPKLSSGLFVYEF